MARELPLNAIRVFHVVGRVLSLKQAADELGVTPSAVSHQISSLEDFLGLKLLRREGNGVALTAQGALYLRQISEGMTQLTRATRWVQASKGQSILRVSAPPSLATLWLMPRLHKFIAANADVPLAIVSMPNYLVARARDRLDVMIRYSREPQSGLHAEPLGRSELLLVASPQLLKGKTPLNRPADLRKHTLLQSNDDLYYEESNPGWQGWLQAARQGDLQSDRYLSFSPRHLMHQAVMDGLGVGLLRRVLAADALASGKLFTPFGPTLAVDASYYVTCERNVADRADVRTFRKWLLSEVAASEAVVDKACARWNQ